MMSGTLVAAALYVVAVTVVGDVDLALVLTPLTKIVHCILAPLTQLLAEAGWHFPAASGRNVANRDMFASPLSPLRAESVPKVTEAALSCPSKE